VAGGIDGRASGVVGLATAERCEADGSSTTRGMALQAGHAVGAMDQAMDGPTGADKQRRFRSPTRPAVPDQVTARTYPTEKRAQTTADGTSRQGWRRPGCG